MKGGFEIKTNIIIESLSLMVDTENGTTSNMKHGAVIYVNGYIEIDKEGKVLGYKIEQDQE